MEWEEVQTLSQSPLLFIIIIIYYMKLSICPVNNISSNPQQGERRPWQVDKLKHVTSEGLRHTIEAEVKRKESQYYKYHF